MNILTSGPFKTHQKIILASGSPRRRDLLESLGIQMSIYPSSLTEPQPMSDEEAIKYACRMAEIKTLDIAEQHPHNFILGADTIVVLQQKIMGKPKSKDQALQMLEQLSGKTHQVITGFSFVSPEQELTTRAVITNVKMRDSTREELLGYIATGEPMDKAGAYAIQGIGTFLVTQIDGSYSNVVGLPLSQVVESLLKVGVISARNSLAFS